MQITIQARDIRAGDIIDLGGQPVTVHTAAYGTGGGKVAVVLDCGYPGSTAVLYFAPDAMFTVDRHDPEAELVRIMAGAMEAADNCKTAELAEVAYGRLARAALAAAREAGAL